MLTSILFTIISFRVRAVLLFIGFLSSGTAVFPLPAGSEDSSSHDIGITVTESALISVEGAAGISFEVLSDILGNVAGEEPSIFPSSSAVARLLYTSIVAGENETRTIQVKHDGNMPAGLVLNLEVGIDAGNGAGTVGITVPALDLTDSDQPAITGIGSAYTGTDGNQDGHLLTYRLTIDDMAELFATNVDVTVTYTLTTSE